MFRCDNPTATDADQKAHMSALIDRYRWAVQFIETEPGTPPWAYTVGLSSYGHPELVVTGMLHPFNQQLLNGLAARVMDGEAPEPGLRLALADGPTIEWVAVRKPASHLHTAVQLFGRRVRAVQAVHADHRGTWPWEVGYRNVVGGQPIWGVRGHRPLAPA